MCSGWWSLRCRCRCSRAQRANAGPTHCALTELQLFGCMVLHPRRCNSWQSPRRTISYSSRNTFRRATRTHIFRSVACDFGVFPFTFFSGCKVHYVLCVDLLCMRDDGPGEYATWRTGNDTWGICVACDQPRTSRVRGIMSQDTSQHTAHKLTASLRFPLQSKR